MKVLHIVGFYPEIGGPFASVKELLKKLSEKGIEIKILSPIPKNYNVKKLDSIKELPFEVEYIEEQLPRFIMPSFSFKFIEKIKEYKRKYDLIHLAGLFDFYAIPFLLLDTKFIYSAHGSFMKNAYEMIKLKKIKKDIYMKLIGKRILKKASIIRLLTEEEKEHFLSFYPGFEDKIRVVPNGIDISGFDVSIKKDELINKYPQLKGKKIILFLGRINWIKGLDILIPVFSKLYKENKDFHLLIAGKDDGDGYIEKVKGWIRDYGLRGMDYGVGIKGYGLWDKDYGEDVSVTFTGLLTGRDKLMAFYGSDIFVLPSYSEGLPTAVIEAMACGCPVVVSDKVGISREISQNNAGIIVKTDVESVYDGIKRLIEDEKLKKEISENGKKMVKEYYDINKVADEMIKVYEEAMKKG